MRPLNVLFSSCGRRVSLVRYFRGALERLGRGEVVCADSSALAPALFEADRREIVPPCDDPQFIPAMLDLCEKHDICCVVPLIDTELPMYAEAKEMFAERGTLALVSSPAVTRICGDKLETAAFFSKSGVASLATQVFQPDAPTEVNYPVVVKPRFGSAGKGVFRARNEAETIFYAGLIQNPIVQEYAAGQEITIDCLCDTESSLVNAVTRERLEIRAGESSKGRTFKDESLLQQVAAICDTLRPIGPVTIQCFRRDGTYLFSEINPRFGGGYPLAQAAGADYPYLILQMVLGRKVPARLGEYIEDLVMLRFDEAFYVRREDLPESP